MSKIITFSRKFPAHHPKAGEQTHFVEQFWKSILVTDISKVELPNERENYCFNYHKISAKHHTIRAGNRFKVGDLFSPRVWSGKPYYSKQITIAPDTEVLQTWNVKIQTDDLGTEIYINDRFLTEQEQMILASNDGLTLHQLKEWIDMKNFQGQIICWSPDVKY